jgi:YVTN family beta-propeller protein
MRRFLLVIWAVSAVLPQLHAQESTIYTSNPGTILTTISAKTLTGGGIIPAGIDSTVAVLPSDGSTFYMAAPSLGNFAKGEIIAVDRRSGKTLQTYRTKNYIWNPISLAVAPNQSQIYVDTCSSTIDDSTCQGGNVEVLDVATGQNLAVISFGSDQVFGIAAAPDGSTVYAVHYYNPPICVSCGGPTIPSTIPSTAITAIDATSLQPGASLALGGYPSAVAISPDSQTGFVASGENVYQIALAQMTLEETIPVEGALFMALSSDGSTLVATEVDAGYLNSELSFINTATGAITGPVTLNGAVSGVSIAPDGGAAYVTAFNPDAVFYVVSTQELKVLAQPPIGDVLGIVVAPSGEEIYPLLAAGSSAEVIEQGSVTPSKLLRTASATLLALSPDGQTLYSTGTAVGLWATSTTTGQVVKTMLPVNTVYGFAVSPDGSTLYAVFPGDSLAVINASTGAIETTISLPAHGHYFSLALTPAGDKLYLPASSTTLDDTVVIDTTTLAIIATIANTGSVAISPSGDVVYIGTPSAVDVFDTATNTITGTIALAGAGPIVFSPDGTLAYAASGTYASDSVSVIDTSTLAVTGTASIGLINGMAVTADGTLLYVGGPAVTEFSAKAEPGSIINTQSLQVTGTFQSGGGILIH